MISRARLDELLSKNKMSMRDLADASGVSYDTIYSIRSGRRPNTSSATVRKLAKAFRASANDLLEDAEELEEESPLLLRQLTDIAAELSETRQEELIRIADAFKKLEDEESEPPLTRNKMLRLLTAYKSLGPDGLADLIQAIRSERGRGDTPGRWLIDLGDAPEHGTQDTGEGE